MTATKRNASDLVYIEDRWYSDGKPKARCNQGKRYRARWVDEDGIERSTSFVSEKAAKAHLKQVARGEYANRNGRTIFSDFYKQWSEDQPWTAGTVRAPVIPRRR